MTASTAVPVRMEAAAGGAGGSWYVLLQGLARLVGGGPRGDRDRGDRGRRGFHAAVPADVMHGITAAICDHPDRVRAIHLAAAFDPSRTARDRGEPLHGGATRYVRERGWAP